MDADHLPEVLGRLKLTALRDRLDTLLDEAARRELSLRDTLALLCEGSGAPRRAAHPDGAGDCQVPLRAHAGRL